MEFIPVSSSNIAGYSYEGDTLTIQFNNGGIWAYQHVPPVVFQGFLNAQSKGSFLARNIKPSYGADKVS